MRLSLSLFAAVALASSVAAAQPKPKADKAPPLPPTPVRLWIVAPEPKGAWTMRLDNEGDAPVRIPADVRLLRFEIELRDGKRTTKIKCSPGALRPAGFPEERALVLRPGESYIEEFDPRLACFGKDAAGLTGSAVVRTRFGWDPPPKGQKKPPNAPFAAEGTKFPAVWAPLRELTAPTMVLSYEHPERAEAQKPPAAPQPTAPEPKKDPHATKPEDGPKPGDPKAVDAKTGEPADAKPQPPPIVDENAPRLALEAKPYSDASSPARVSVTVVASNAGHRPMFVALLQRMVSMRVEGPDRVRVCESSPATHAVPRERYRTLNPGSTTAFTVLLDEVCPDDAFSREGLYRVTPAIDANETGSGISLNAWTGRATAQASTLVRVQDAPSPYYSSPPKAVPTPKDEAEPVAGDETKATP